MASPDETFAALTREVAEQMLTDLRWTADMLVEPSDFPGELWWLRQTEPLPGFPRGGVGPCCEQAWPCLRHQTVGIDPDACQHCGVPQQRHYQRWTGGVGRHGWTAPTDAQRLARMRARRDRDYAAATGGGTEGTA